MINEGKKEEAIIITKPKINLSLFILKVDNDGDRYQKDTETAQQHGEGKRSIETGTRILSPIY
jgi:hypothetical protein